MRNIRKTKYVPTLIVSAVLCACGGGGGGGGGAVNSNPVVPVAPLVPTVDLSLSYPIKQIVQNYIADQKTSNVTSNVYEDMVVLGTDPVFTNYTTSSKYIVNYSAAGQETVTNAASVFNGAPTIDKTMQMTSAKLMAVSATRGDGSPLNINDTTSSDKYVSNDIINKVYPFDSGTPLVRYTYTLDSNGHLLKTFQGHTSVFSTTSYCEATTTNDLPALAKVGDTGTWSVMSCWGDSTKSTRPNVANAIWSIVYDTGIAATPVLALRFAHVYDNSDSSYGQMLYLTIKTDGTFAKNAVVYKILTGQFGRFQQFNYKF